MVDLAKYPKQTTYSLFNCEDNSLEAVVDLCIAAIQKQCSETHLPAAVHKEEFKTANAARKMGGIISFVGKLAQKSEPGITLENPEDQYRIHLVACQIQDEVSFDVYAYTGFNHISDTRKRDFCSRRYERAQECVHNAFRSLMEGN